MTNPYSERPEDALAPRPPGCSGNLLLEALRLADPGVAEEEYLGAFDRRNLLVGGWSAPRARAAGVDLRLDVESGTVVVLGAATWSALDLPGAAFLRSVVITTILGAAVGSVARREATWWKFPHPSGKNRWFNARGRRLRFGRALLAVMRAGDP